MGEEEMRAAWVMEPPKLTGKIQVVDYDAPGPGGGRYLLVIREPDWHQHRCLEGPDTNVNLHVYSPGCPEIDRYLVFRDRLRGHPEDRAHYQRVIGRARAGT